MFNPEETLATIGSYLNKLKKTIEKQATFTWFKIKIVPKKRIDDLLCCIEGSFPEEYKNHIKTLGSNNLSGYKAYQKLIAAIRRKSFFCSENYSVLYEEALHQIMAFQSGLKSDLKKVFEANNNMF